MRDSESGPACPLAVALKASPREAYLKDVTQRRVFEKSRAAQAISSESAADLLSELDRQTDRPATRSQS